MLPFWDARCGVMTYIGSEKPKQKFTGPKIYKIGYIEVTTLEDIERRFERVVIEKDMDVYKPWVEFLLHKIEEYKKQQISTRRILI